MAVPPQDRSGLINVPLSVRPALHLPHRSSSPTPARASCETRITPPCVTHYLAGQTWGIQATRFGPAEWRYFRRTWRHTTRRMSWAAAAGGGRRGGFEFNAHDSGCRCRRPRRLVIRRLRRQQSYLRDGNGQRIMPSQTYGGSRDVATLPTTCGNVCLST